MKKEKKIANEFINWDFCDLVFCIFPFQFYFLSCPAVSKQREGDSQPGPRAQADKKEKEIKLKNTLHQILKLERRVEM